ncbi:MAG TPA: hypothetical protein VIO64_01025 [Pseudobacteroides sp.]|uniref:hypothetical protein n=1 Tax=Pseudobacteroides sp. TaxID=1968840 RepID=UPI002F95DA32
MSNIIEKYKEQFLYENELEFKKEYFCTKENNDLNEIVQNGEESAVNRILEEYNYDFDDGKNTYLFYRKVPLNYSKEDIDQFIQLKMLEYTKNTNSSINTMLYLFLLMHKPAH